ncbi:MAG: hypothetical protein BGO39_18100 [Chloroflexi bacterium 54-19]|nr:MAG: hypothetical protein BGO39_18100 [Chloroflexi bacterium 54-19]
MSEEAPDLAATRLELICTDDILLPVDMPRVTYNLFINFVKELDINLYSDLVNPAIKMRPFTVSQLLFTGGERRGNNFFLEAGTSCFIRFTGLNRSVVAILRQLTEKLPPTIEIADYPFTIKDYKVGDDLAARTGFSSYKTLLERNFYDVKRPSAGLSMWFLSPTLFKTDHQELPLPVPDLVFSSLLQRWNAFSPGPLPEDIRMFAGENLRLERCRIETRQLMVDAKNRVGFTGYVRFYAQKYERFYLQTLHSLGELSFFSGVGYKTTAGLGQVRLG